MHGFVEEIIFGAYKRNIHMTSSNISAHVAPSSVKK